MKKFLATSVALLGLAGVAVAQEVPAFYGDAQANVLNADASAAGGSQGSFTVTSQANATVPGTNGFNVNLSDNYSGK